MNVIFVVVGCVVYGEAAAQRRPASIGFLGDTNDVATSTRAGIALIGGGGDVHAAFKWLIDRSGGGNVVVLRASQNYLYNRTIDSLGKVRSVETLLINSRDLANNDTVASIIRNAEMLFITGGDQSNYMRFWRGTKTQDAINYLLNEKKVPVGGTSAGCAVLTGFYYSGENRSATSAVLNNPYDSSVTIYNNDFLSPPFLTNVISDQHYVARRRQGRHVTFLARIAKDWNKFALGIAPDERTAVCIDEKGNARVFGSGKAYFLITDSLHPPVRVEPQKPLHWPGKAVRVYEIQGTETGSGFFPLDKIRPADARGGKWFWWWVEDGELKQREVEDP